VQRHEAPRRIDPRVHHVQVEAGGLGEVLPVLHGGTSHRVGTDVDAGGRDRVEVERVGQLRAVGAPVVVANNVAGGPLVGGPRDCGGVPQQLVGAGGDHRGGIGVCGPAVGRVVLEPAVARRVV